jgi:carboxylate-amine ligase
MGVEEEFLLLDPSGDVTPLAPAVLALTGARHDRGEIKPELMTYQLETVSGVCTELDDLEQELTGLRARIGEAAADIGVRVVASGRAPFGDRGLEMLTADPRYREIAARYPTATATSGTCACHVHIGIADRDLAVQVLVRLRPWLPTLLALTGNSPFAGGVDTGWSSSRYRSQLSWPTFRPPVVQPDAAGYDRMVTSLVLHGLAFDARSVYLLARVSPRHPTIEIRVADTLPTAADAAVFAGVVRALVTTLVDELRRGRTPVAIPQPRPRAVPARLLAAAHHGLGGAVARPRPPTSGTTRNPLIAHLLDVILPALEAAGDAGTVLAGLDRTERLGTGAQRQRQLWSEAASREEFVAALARVSTPVGAPD